MADPAISHTPRSDAVREAEISVLATVYKFALDCRAKKEAAPESRPDDARKDVRDAGTYSNIT